MASDTQGSREEIEDSYHTRPRECAFTFFPSRANSPRVMRTNWTVLLLAIGLVACSSVRHLPPTYQASLLPPPPNPPSGGATNNSKWQRHTGTVFSFSQSTPNFEILTSHLEDNTGAVVAVTFYYYPLVTNWCVTNFGMVTCYIQTNIAGGSTNPLWRIRLSWYGSAPNKYVVETSARIGDTFEPISLYLTGYNTTIGFTSGIPFSGERYFRLRRF